MRGDGAVAARLRAASASGASGRTRSAPTSSRSSHTGAAAFDLEPDGHHYFDIHHTEADTLDKIRPEDLRRNAAAIALLAYVLAER